MQADEDGGGDVVAPIVVDGSLEAPAAAAAAAAAAEARLSNNTTKSGFSYQTHLTLTFNNVFIMRTNFAPARARESRLTVFGLSESFFSPS